MARRRKLSPERKEFINGLLEHYQPNDAHDVQEMLKDLLGDTLQGMLEAEMDEKLGYSKYDYKNKDTDDSRNGYSPKTVTSSMGPIDLDIPRDRKGEFEPKIVKKNQTDISDIEDQVLSMYAKGMTTRDISAHLRDVYGVDASAEMISHMTDRILPLAREWQNRPLERKYAIVFMDAVHFHLQKSLMLFPRHFRNLFRRILSSQFLIPVLVMSYIKSSNMADINSAIIFVASLLYPGVITTAC